MPILQSIAYGIIQGLTEFLPISSSAHLVLLPWFFKWNDPGLAFDVALHIGTLVAVVAFFRKDIIQFIRLVFLSLKGERYPESKLPWQVLVGTIPGAILGFLFEDMAESTFRSPILIVFTLTGMGLFLLFADKIKKVRKPISQITWRDAILIGVFQGMAVIPGVSRSGITISMALLLGLERQAAVLFSFYLSIPIILGAGLLKSGVFIASMGSISFWVGLISAAVSGWLAIAFLLKYIKTHSFTPFVIYRLLLAAIILLALILV